MIIYYLHTLKVINQLDDKYKEYLTTDESKLFLYSITFNISNYYNYSKRKKTDYGISNYFNENRLDVILKELKDSNMPLRFAYSFAVCYACFYNIHTYLAGYIAYKDEKYTRRSFNEPFSPYMRFFDKHMTKELLNWDFSKINMSDYFVKIEYVKNIFDVLIKILKEKVHCHNPKLIIEESLQSYLKVEKNYSKLSFKFFYKKFRHPINKNRFRYLLKNYKIFDKDQFNKQNELYYNKFLKKEVTYSYDEIIEKSILNSISDIKYIYEFFEK